MVRTIKYTLAIIIFCTGCVRTEIIQNDNFLHYVNYQNIELFPFDLNDYNFTNKCDSFDINFPSKAKKILLSLEQKVILDNLYFNFTVDYDNFSDKSIRKNLLDLSGEHNLYDIYFCGTSTLNRHIDSYIFLFQDKNINSKYLNWSSIIVINLKNNNICSILELANFSIVSNSKENLIRTYKRGNNILLQINSIHTTEYFLHKQSQSQAPDYDKYPHFSNDNKFNYQISGFFKKLKSKIIKDKRFYYTLFYIDDNGFVRFCNIKTCKSIDIHEN